jgi:hypothetical protein
MFCLFDTVSLRFLKSPVLLLGEDAEMKYADWIPGKIVLTERSVDLVWNDGRDHNVVFLIPMRFYIAGLCYKKHKTLEASCVFYTDSDVASSKREWTVTELPEQIDAILRANWEAERRFLHRIQNEFNGL